MIYRYWIGTWKDWDHQYKQVKLTFHDSNMTDKHSSNIQEVWPPTESTKINGRNSSAMEQPCKYILSKHKLGDGTFSGVFECKNKLTGQHYAAKMYKKSLVYGLESMLQNEFLVLKKISMNHDNILKLIDHFETASELYLVTEIAYGGELFDKITRSGHLEESQSSAITQSLMNAISYLHANNIVHNDLKAENILFRSRKKDSMNVLVADFGLARILHPEEKLTGVRGTLSYIAPEVLNGSGYDFAIDIWSVGVIVYFMLCGYMPFDCETDEETKSAILAGDYMYEPPEYWLHVSPEAKDFIDCCLKTDPSERLTVDSASIHPFLNPLRAISKPVLKVSSSTDLHESLKAAIMHLHLPIQSAPGANLSVERSTGTSHTVSTVSSKLSLLGSSRTNASYDSKLDGACCDSPDIVSRFTTPVISNVVSRLHSTNNILDYIDTPPGDIDSAKFYI